MKQLLILNRVIDNRTFKKFKILPKSYSSYNDSTSSIALRREIGTKDLSQFCEQTRT